MLSKPYKAQADRPEQERRVRAGTTKPPYSHSHFCINLTVNTWSAETERGFLLAGVLWEPERPARPFPVKMGPSRHADAPWVDRLTGILGGNCEKRGKRTEERARENDGRKEKRREYPHCPTWINRQRVWIRTSALLTTLQDVPVTNRALRLHWVAGQQLVTFTRQKKHADVNKRNGPHSCIDHPRPESTKRFKVILLGSGLDMNLLRSRIWLTPSGLQQILKQTQFQNDTLQIAYKDFVCGLVVFLALVWAKLRCYSWVPNQSVVVVVRERGSWISSLVNPTKAAPHWGLAV